MNSTNLGILIGSVSLIIGLGAAVTAIYLRYASQSRPKPPMSNLDAKYAQGPGLSWIRPLMLAATIVLWLGACGGLWEAYSTGNWAKAFQSIGPFLLGWVVLGGWWTMRAEQPVKYVGQ